MTQRRSFHTDEERERAHQGWEEEIRRKAIWVIKACDVTLKMDRIWREARFLFRFSLPTSAAGWLGFSLLLPPRNGKVTIAVASTPVLIRLRPLLQQMTKDLRLLLGESVQVDLASFDSLLEENRKPSVGPRHGEAQEMAGGDQA
jgi:hypothetical protein